LRQNNTPALLKISENIIPINHGRGGGIWAESQGLKHGSDFIVELPQA
jgi:hypothetical protein